MGKQRSPRSPHPAANWENSTSIKGYKHDKYHRTAVSRIVCAGKIRHIPWLHRNIRSIVFIFMLIGLMLVLGSLVASLFDPATYSKKGLEAPSDYSDAPEERNILHDDRENSPVLFSRLLHMASVSLAQREIEKRESMFWNEKYQQASIWKPCADIKHKRAGTVNNNNHTGFILVSANGGLNQQRVAVCNAVAVAALLNATLVIPRFLYSNVWKDPSQFSDIYQEETFMNVLKDDISIVKELPNDLKSLDFEAIGSLVTDADLSKEATPDEYLKKILPILSRNGIVHLLGFGNQLGFDQLPSYIQTLRCKCNFHALKFAPKIQETSSLLLKRIRHGTTSTTRMLEKKLIGKFMFDVIPFKEHVTKSSSSSKYLALHLRFEVDMVAYLMCDFGGGLNESIELQAYREEPLLLERLKKTRPISPEELRKTGKCPLTPEEAALVLASLGFSRGTYIYLAGSQIYRGKSRMKPLISLYPNLVTKEDLLSPTELEPFRKFSSQLAALDFIVCAASDVFAMTDLGSQLSSLVSGFRMYYGEGNAPNLRPSKKRLSAILQENSTIDWHNFQNRITKMIEEGQEVHVRNHGKSIYQTAEMQ